MLNGTNDIVTHKSQYYHHTVVILTWRLLQTLGYSSSVLTYAYF